MCRALADTGRLPEYIASLLRRGVGGLAEARATCDGANIAYFILTYDAALRENFDPIATHMARSLDATSLPGGKPLCP